MHASDVAGLGDVSDDMAVPDLPQNLGSSQDLSVVGRFSRGRCSTCYRLLSCV
ncbi:hypothetical protein Syun_012627 [Stephania yunnanensis]|uniref:Uncharacterized protein n=1 Tax=Stephania yunnanensis TaxID=152371 RepID=A0AAP0PGK1_9MAGN